MKNKWLNVDDEEKKMIFSYSDNYIKFLNEVKTEREAVKYIKDKLDNNGFKNIQDVDSLVCGDKVYYVNRNKSIYAAIIGSDITDGIKVIGSHIDSPRLDLKPNPLYEDTDLALLKTHYYGGIKKYQWTCIPLSIRGVVAKTDGSVININIGEDDDITFTITDLLPHLSQKQDELKLKEGINGENLNLLVGNVPLDDKENSIKKNIMNILDEKYNICENDFLSAELEVVPAFKAKSLGFDRSMVAGYGQDDRVCSYANLEALLNTTNTSKTIVSIFADKEEIGSYGNTGMMSNVFDTFITMLITKSGKDAYLINEIFSKSKMLSADVGAAVDPQYKDVSDLFNSSYINNGVELNKYTGSRGKSGASDANAEFVAEVRCILEKENIPYQITELGKVDIGGGGTIAFILANKGMDVIDCGVPILSMHSPYEVSGKLDIYMMYKAYKAFYNK